MWSPTTTTAGAYTTDAGTYDSSTNTQTATLTISAEELGRLKYEGAVHSFTCKVTLADEVHTVQQKLTLFTPSMLIFEATRIMKFWKFRDLLI